MNAFDLPESYTSTSSIIVMYFNSGDVPTKLDFYASFVKRNSTYFESQTLGDSDYCSGSNLCSENGGDCDFSTHCANGIRCGSNNCPADLGYPNGTDCCHNPCQDGYSLFIIEMTLTISSQIIKCL